MAKKAEAEAAVKDPMYTKEQFAASSQFRNRRDLINALLEDGTTYTWDTVKKMVNEFMKREVE